MSKIVVEFDTVEKSLDVKVDGKSMNNVENASFYCYGDEAFCELVQCSSDEENGMRTHIRTIASDSLKGKELVSAGAEKSSVIPDYVVAKSLGSVLDDIKEYLR